MIPFRYLFPLELIIVKIIEEVKHVRWYGKGTVTGLFFSDM